jgi:hypothetical protein
MLDVRKLVSYTQSHRPVLVSNASNVSVTFGETTYGKDPRGYYKAISANTRTRAKGKKNKKVEIRLYFPKTRSKTDQYIPEKLRSKTEKYIGPKKEPKFDLNTKAWVFCTCEYFLFHCEVADAETDNSTINAKPRNFMTTKNGQPVRITENNGAAPTKTNPSRVAHLCKHILSCLRKGALLKK